MLRVFSLLVVFREIPDEEHARRSPEDLGGGRVVLSGPWGFFLEISDNDDEDDDDGDGDEEYHRCFPEDLRGGRVVL